MQKDKIKWDKKYSQKPELLAKREASGFVKKYAPLAPVKKALDIACGGGRHIFYLSELGFEIDGVDISSVALNRLQEVVDSNVKLIEADLDSFKFEKERYGLIVKANFLDRAVIERAKDALIKGGIFIVETYVEDENNEKKDSNPDFLLKKDELKEIFKDGFEVLEYKEFDNEPYEIYRMKKAAIAVVRV